MNPHHTPGRAISSDAITRYFTPPLPFPALGAPPETLAEYLDPGRFPLTTRPDLSPRQQFLADSSALKVMRAYLLSGGTLTYRQRARLVELEAKDVARPALLAQLLDPAARN
jgi:hypothetical protein